LRCPIGIPDNVVGRRRDATIRAVVNRTAMGKDRSPAPWSPKTTTRRPPVDREPASSGEILWILRSGAPWKYLPKEYPHPSTCWRRLRDWEEQDIWLKIWRTFLGELQERQQLKWSESFLDGSFAPAKKGGDPVGKTKRGKETKWMVVVDGAGVPLGKHLDSAAPAEVRLAERTLATIRVPHGSQPGRPRQKPERVIADKADDSDPLRKRLQRRGIELIVAHMRNRVRPLTQDGRALRRYRRRWIVERTIAWLGNFHRLVVRWGSLHNHLRSVLSYRLLHDRLTEGCAIASSNDTASAASAYVQSSERIATTADPLWPALFLLIFWSLVPLNFVSRNSFTSVEPKARRRLIKFPSSICRIRSRLRPSSFPISFNVLISPSQSPYRLAKMLLSRSGNKESIPHTNAFVPTENMSSWRVLANPNRV